MGVSWLADGKKKIMIIKKNKNQHPFHYKMGYLYKKIL
jgi:hypothetical protein